MRSGHLAGMPWSVCISKSKRIICASFSWKNSRFCIYHLVVRSNFNLLILISWAIPHGSPSSPDQALFYTRFVLIIIIIPCEFFSLAFSWWSFAGDWVTASLKSLGLFLVICYSLDVFNSSSDFQLFQPLLPSLWGSFQVHQIQSVSQSPSCSIAF